MTHITEWLAELDLSEYAEIFVANKIGLDVLPDIVDADLQSLDIPIGDRKRILRAIRQLAEREAKEQQAPPPGLDEGFPRNRDHGERRQLTLVYADLVGSTTLSERFDLEDYYTIIAAYLNCCTEIVQKHGGYIAQYQGDGVFAYFGYPRADEDDGERAVSAGLEIVDSVGKLESPGDITLQARVGIATGIVLVGGLLGRSRSIETMGEAPNLAARLQGMAPPNGVIIDSETRQLLGQQFICRGLGQQSLKGFSQPTEVFVVRESQRRKLRFEEHQHGQPTEFVGRDEELNLLGRRWDSARRGDGQAVLISGEPGLGKSRLARMFCREFADRTSIRIDYQCLPNQANSAFQPIIDGMEEAVGFSDDDTREEKLDSLKLWLEQQNIFDEQSLAIYARLLSLVDGEQENESSEAVAAADHASEPVELKSAVFSVLNRRIEHHLETRSVVVIVFEDLHWIDPTTREYLDSLVRWIVDKPVLLLCTSRPQYLPDWISDANVTYLNLRRLDGASSRKLVSLVLEGVKLPDEVQAEIISKTDGVPLFLEELTKAMRDSGSLTRTNGAYSLSPDADALRIMPTTLLGSLLARLDRLPGAQKVAPLGAAIGRSFRFPLLREVVDLDDAELQSILDRLLDAELLSKRGDPPNVIYTFKHALVQDAAYQTMPRGRRRIVHYRIADVLSTRFADVTANNPEILAYHYSRANYHHEAHDFWRSAAVLARRRSAHREAVAHISEALVSNRQIDSLDVKIENEIELREMLNIALEVTNWGSVELADNRDRLRELVAERDDDELLWQIHANCGDFILDGRVADARVLGEKMLHWSEDEQENQIASVLGNRSLGLCEFLSADFNRAVPYFESAIKQSQVVEANVMQQHYYANTVLASRSLLAWCLTLAGDNDAAAATSLAVRLAEDEADTHSRTYALSILSSVYQCAGDVNKSYACASEALELSRVHESLYWEAWAQIMRGWGLAALGSHQQGILELTEGIASYEKARVRQMVPYANVLLADAYCSASDAGSAAEVLERLESSNDLLEIRYIDGIQTKVQRRIDAM